MVCNNFLSPPLLGYHPFQIFLYPPNIHTILGIFYTFFYPPLKKKITVIGIFCGQSNAHVYKYKGKMDIFFVKCFSMTINLHQRSYSKTFSTPFLVILPLQEDFSALAFWSEEKSKRGCILCKYKGFFILTNTDENLHEGTFNKCK